MFDFVTAKRFLRGKVRISLLDNVVNKKHKGLSLGATVPFIFGYVQAELQSLFAGRSCGNSACAEQERNKQDQATGIDAEVKGFELSATATQKQDNEQYPGAVATAEGHSASATAATAVVFAVSAIVKHSVEHFYLHSPSASAFVFDFNSLLYNMVFAKKVLRCRCLV